MIESNYKLPPLPYPQIPGDDYSLGDMWDYAYVAIKAYLQQYGGEPVEVRLLLQAKEFLEGYHDEGPDGEGWKSDALETLIAEIEVATKTPQPAEPVLGCPESDKWNCKYCHRVNSCPVEHLRDAQPAAPTKQYYYRMTGCKADETTSPNCICWHDEGTGPFPDLKEGGEVGGVFVSWRDKPSAPKFGEKE